MIDRGLVVTLQVIKLHKCNRIHSNDCMNQLSLLLSDLIPLSDVYV